jgi:hypothetical protein
MRRTPASARGSASLPGVQAAGGLRTVTVAAVVAALLASLFALFGPAAPASAAVLEEANPTMTCVGGNQQSIDILMGLEALDPPGTVVVDTPTTIEIDAPGETLLQGATYEVDLSWSFTIPTPLVEIAQAFEADIFLQDMTLGVNAEGAGTGSYEFPENFPTDGSPVDMDNPAVLQSAGTITPDAQGEIVFELDSPANITVWVPATPDNNVPVSIGVVLDCTFEPIVIGSVMVDGEATPPGPPTGVTAVTGPGQASVSWTPPEMELGELPITGYLVSAEPGGGLVQVGPDVTSIDVIGLTPGSDYTFQVIAENAVGASDPSEASNEVTILPYSFEFSDVPQDHAFFAEIQWMAETGLSTGYEDDTYKPGGTLSRQAMSAFLYRLAEQPADPTCSEAPFTDVPVDHPFCGEIAWMKVTGISTGYVDGSYAPAAGLSREAMSAFMYRAAGSPDGDDPQCLVPPFSDVPITNAFCGEITWMAEVGISEGYEDGTYKPANTLTRQAMSAFLYRFTLVSPGVVA